MTIYADKLCTACLGTGSYPLSFNSTCLTCKGRGTVVDEVATAKLRELMTRLAGEGWRGMSGEELHLVAKELTTKETLKNIGSLLMGNIS